MYLFNNIKLLIIFFILLGSVSMADMQNPQTDKDYFKLGNSYYREQKYNNAINNYKKALRENTDTKLKAWIYYNMGNCYFNKNDKEKARKYYIKSLEIDSLDYEAKYNLEMTKNPPKSKNNSSSSKNNNKDKDKNKKGKNESKNDKSRDDKENKSGMTKDEAKEILDRVNQSEKDTKNKSKSGTGQNQNKSNKNGSKGKGGEKDW